MRGELDSKCAGWLGAGGGGRPVARAYAKFFVRVHGHLESRPQDGQTGGFVSPLRKRRRSNPKGTTEEENAVTGSVAVVEILLPKFSKLQRVEGLPQKQVGRSRATTSSCGTSSQGQEGLLAQEYQRKPLERRRVGVLDNGILKVMFDRKGKEGTFFYSVERFLAGIEVEETRSKEVAEKVW